ncbi:hypothetical protein HPP92_020038 [Vanilla planifolia]|uniref:Uncharacterized protein n=1 Tax=Vanilla planifolia TaxID=51239 RepID=A0A835Q1N2_VANPL|nr:hypothetical protein HPP92_020038 [Vanilla planifolia]
MKQSVRTVSYIAERVVGDWIFGIVFQVDPTHKLSFVIFSGAKVLKLATAFCGCPSILPPRTFATAAAGSLLVRQPCETPNYCPSPVQSPSSIDGL